MKMIKALQEEGIEVPPDLDWVHLPLQEGVEVPLDLPWFTCLFKKKA